jgi:hypothetical protein
MNQKLMEELTKLDAELYYEETGYFQSRLDKDYGYNKEGTPSNLPVAIKQSAAIGKVPKTRSYVGDKPVETAVIAPCNTEVVDDDADGNPNGMPAHDDKPKKRVKSEGWDGLFAAIISEKTAPDNAIYNPELKKQPKITKFKANGLTDGKPACTGCSGNGIRGGKQCPFCRGTGYSAKEATGAMKQQQDLAANQSSPGIQGAMRRGRYNGDE